MVARRSVGGSLRSIRCCKNVGSGLFNHANRFELSEAGRIPEKTKRTLPLVSTLGLCRKRKPGSTNMSWSGLPAKLERFIIPEPNSGCWIWLGGLRSKEEYYGGTSWRKRTWRTHRLVYHLLKGKISKKLDIDHFCRNRICCNPDHLEAVPRKINIHRGVGVAPRNLRKTHCPQGHEYTTENTYVWANQRFCRTCSRKYKRAYEKKLKDANS